MATGTPLATITGQVQGVGVDGSGPATQGWTVSFETATGQKGSVLVPNSRYTMAGVQAAVKALASEMEAVMGSSVLGD